MRSSRSEAEAESASSMSRGRPLDMMALLLRNSCVPSRERLMLIVNFLIRVRVVVE